MPIPQHDLPGINELLPLLEKRKEQLTLIIKEKEQALKRVPAGSLKLHRNKNSVQYYHYLPSDATGSTHYIRKNNKKLISSLAQKSYDQEVLSLMQAELPVLEKLLSIYNNRSADMCYGLLHEARKQLVVPISKSDQQYRDEWNAIKYTGRSFSPDAPEYYTDKGERVRSKSEIIIANMLAKADILYHYEYPLFLRGYGTVYPDFTCFNMRKKKVFYLEHLGMMDDMDYVLKTMKKLTSYEANGIYPGTTLLFTHETQSNPLKQKTVQALIEEYLI